jgi:hypothetical protein
MRHSFAPAVPLAGIGPGMYGARSIAAGAGLTGEPTVTCRVTFPECSATLNVSDERVSESIRCSNRRGALKNSASWPKDEADNDRPTSDGDWRNPAAAVDRRDEARGPQATPETKRTTYPEGQSRRERQAAGVGVVAATALLLGLTGGGGVAYLHLKPVVATVAVDASPAQRDAAPAAQPAQNQRWQYLVVSLPADVNQATDQLNGLAGDRWEYAGLISTSIPSVWIRNPLNNANEQVAAGHESSIVLRRPKIAFNVEGALEGESLKITAKSRDFELHWQDTMSWVHGQWSGDRQLYASPLKAGDWTDLELPAAAEGKYRITVYLTKSWNYGVIQFLMNGTRIGKPIDGFNADTVVSTGPIDLGAANLKKGVNRLVVEVVGTNRMSAQGRYSWGLDCVVLKQE